jgi:hypothetical protein
MTPLIPSLTTLLIAAVGAVAAENPATETPPAKSAPAAPAKQPKKQPTFDAFVESRDTILPWIKEYSPYERKRAAHAGLVERGLNESHFNAVAQNLVPTLQKLGVAEAEIEEIVAFVLKTKNDVLGL